MGVPHQECYRTRVQALREYFTKRHSRSTLPSNMNSLKSWCIRRFLRRSAPRDDAIATEAKQSLLWREATLCTISIGSSYQTFRPMQVGLLTAWNLFWDSVSMHGLGMGRRYIGMAVRVGRSSGFGLTKFPPTDKFRCAHLRRSVFLCASLQRTYEGLEPIQRVSSWSVVSSGAWMTSSPPWSTVRPSVFRHSLRRTSNVRPPTSSA
jgi:hypothetical protein